MRNREASIQADIVARIRKLVPDAVVYAILNDGLFSKSECAKRRWMGLLPGIPDVGIAYRGRSFFLEVKPPGRGLSEEQEDVFAKLQSIGVRCAVVRSADEALTVLVEWGIEIREEVDA